MRWADRGADPRMRAEGDFDRYARSYEAIHARNLEPGGEPPAYYAAYKQREIERILGEDFSLPVLDFGCGVGVLTALLSASFPTVHGYDPSAESVRLAKERAKSAQFFDRPAAMPQDHYGAVILANVLHHVDSGDRPEFLRGVTPLLRAGGTLIASADDAGARELAAWTAAQHSIRVETYGRDETASTKITELKGGVFKIDVSPPSVFALDVPGWHNALNAAAAILVAQRFGAPISDVISKGIGPFAGVERRLELVGTAGDIKVIDDYAHHPAEIAAGIDAFGEGAVVVFQPHTPSRLDAFFDEFVSVLKRARAVVIVETFRSAREQADPHGRARALADAVNGRYAADGETAAHLAAELARPGDAVLVMGAGDVRPVGQRVLELLRTPV